MVVIIGRLLVFRMHAALKGDSGALAHHSAVSEKRGP
jgi:hypothetical protein